MCDGSWNVFRHQIELPWSKQPIVEEPGSKLLAEFLVIVLRPSEVNTAVRMIRNIRLSLLSSKKTAASSVASVGTIIV